VTDELNSHVEHEWNDTDRKTELHGKFHPIFSEIIYISSYV